MLSSYRTGIGPESWGFIDTNNISQLSHTYGPNPYQQRYHAQHGFFLIRGYANPFILSIARRSPHRAPTFSGESYQLRPEVIEVSIYFACWANRVSAASSFRIPSQSNFYAWRATGDPKYQLNAVKMMNAIFKYCKAPVGYAPFPHVDRPDAVSDKRKLQLSPSTIFPGIRRQFH